MRDVMVLRAPVRGHSASLPAKVPKVHLRCDPDPLEPRHGTDVYQLSVPLSQEEPHIMHSLRVGRIKPLIPRRASPSSAGLAGVGTAAEADPLGTPDATSKRQLRHEHLITSPVSPNEACAEKLTGTVHPQNTVATTVL